MCWARGARGGAPGAGVGARPRGWLRVGRDSASLDVEGRGPGLLSLEQAQTGPVFSFGVFGEELGCLWFLQAF